MKTSHDQHSKERLFQEGDLVLARNFGSREKWVPAEVTAATGPVSCQVRLEGSDLEWRRHTDHLRPRAKPSDDEDRPPTQSDNAETDLPMESTVSRPSRQRRPPDRLTYT